MEQNRFRMIGVTFIFLCAIAFPLLNDNLHLVVDSTSTENRAMAKKPVLDINLLDPFPGKYETYYNDHFSVRARLISYYNNFNLNVMHKSPFPDNIAIGYHKWLFHMGREMEAYVAKNPLTHEQLEAWRLDLECQKQYLEKHGCKFYFMVTPSKANIHSENVPYYYYRYNSKGWGEQLLEYLEKNSDINTINVYDRFRELKSDHQLYFKLDNHWNRLGAFYASAVACEKIGRDFPSVKPLSVSDYTVKEVFRKDTGDLGRMIGNPPSFSDTDFEFISHDSTRVLMADNTVYHIHDTLLQLQVMVKDNKDPRKPNMMMISDSYSIYLFPFISQSFNRTAKGFDMWHYSMYPAVVEREKPDVYILMIFEPYLSVPPENRKRLGCN